MKRIEREILDIENGVSGLFSSSLYVLVYTVLINNYSGVDRSTYGPFFLALDVEKLAVITLNTTINHILRVGNSGAQVLQSHLNLYIVYSFMIMVFR